MRQMRQMDIFEFLDALDEYKTKANDAFDEAADEDKEEQVFDDVEEINESAKEYSLIEQLITQTLSNCVKTNTLPTPEETLVIKELDLISRYYNE